MRERKNVKIRVDMLNDTKSKIIDMKPERDLIHYIWMAILLLAGKVNLEGDLYMSKNIPYTIETLAIEFNRGTYQVKLALEVLMELEMIELSENNVYRVKNFAKHQNIKVKEENKCDNKVKNIKNDEVEVKENSLNEAAIDREEVSLEVAVNVDETTEKKTSEEIENLKINNKNINENHDNISDNNVSCDELNKSQDNSPILLENKKNKKSNKRKKKGENIETFDENIEDSADDYFQSDDEEVEEDMICYFHDGDEGKTLDEGECVVKTWAF